MITILKIEKSKFNKKEYTEQDVQVYSSLRISTFKAFAPYKLGLIGE